MAELAIIIVSHGDAHWLTPCLSTVYARAGGLAPDVVVVANKAGDRTREVVERRFPQARVLECENRGFAHANNRGLLATTARYVLFLNPDTEIVDGTLGALVDALDARPEVGLAGVRQVDARGALHPTIRRFPNAARALADALGSERWPLVGGRLGERELDPAAYERERDVDWTSGSFMLARREALISAGVMDERFFLYCEEPDLCLRLRAAGWSIRHMPSLTIVHHAGKAGVVPRMIAQDAYARRQYALKHFSAPHRAAYLGAVGVRWALRSLGAGKDDARRAAARSALRTLSGRAPAPWRQPPATALADSDPRTAA